MMARVRRLPRAVGLVVAAVCASLVLAGCSSFGTPEGYVVRAKVPRTFNLFPGSPVMVLGVDVGIISSLDIEPGDDYVTATMRIDHDTKLPADVRPVVLTDALLGERFIQLDPPYAGGEAFEAGQTIEQPANTPAEFDELLNALQEFIDGMKGGDLPRLVDNLAEVLDGNGEDLGQTLAATRDALQVLKDQDQDLVRLSSKLAGVNETLNQRRQELGTVVQDFAELSRVLADQRVPLDRALSSLARLADETGRLLDANRELVEEDVATLTRVGQTAVRNVDQLSAMLLNSAELFRHAERAMDRERNWLPLVNNTDDLVQYALDTVTNRIAGGFVCEREGIPTDVCKQLAGLIGEVPLDQICIEGLVSCKPDEGDTALPLGEAIEQQLRSGSQGMGSTPQEQEDIDRALDEIVDGIGGLGSGGSSSGDGGTSSPEPSDTETTSDGSGDGSLLDGLLGGGGS